MLNQVLRAQPNLVLYNYNNLTTRLLQATQGNMFVAYNRKKDQYEVHSVKSFYLSKHQVSMNANIDQQYLNEWVIRDIKMRDSRRFRQELMDTETYLDHILSEQEERNSGLYITAGMQELRRILGGN